MAMPTKLKSPITTKRRSRIAPIHPGEVLREEFMAPLQLSANALALALRVPATRVSEIVNERRGITADTALRLARYFDMTPAFWMNLQSRYDLEMAEEASAENICREIQPSKHLEATKRVPA
jgi:addiction module HigA family antidote